VSNDATEIVVGANGRVLVAAADDVVVWPDDVITGSGDDLDAAFKAVGFVTTDGITFTDSKNVNDITAWQAFYPVRKVVTDKMSKVEFTMKQWDRTTVETAFGGGSVSTDGGVSTYVPPEPGELSEIAMIIEWLDGDDVYRLVCPRGLVTGEVAVKVTRTDSADLPVSYEVTPKGTPTEGDMGSLPWYLLTNADQFGS